VWQSEWNGSVAELRFSFCDPYRSFALGRDYSGCPEFFTVTRQFSAADTESEIGHPLFDDLRKDALFILKAWIRYVDSRTAPTEMLTRFDVLRESWSSLAIFIESLLELGSNGFDIECFRRFDRAFGVERNPRDELAYAAAWLEVSSRPQMPESPSMFGHYASSFHQLVSEIALSLDDAINLGLDEINVGFMRPVPGHLIRHRNDGRAVKSRSEAELRNCADRRLQPRLLREIERYRGWNFEETLRKVTAILDMEACIVKGRAITPSINPSSDDDHNRHTLSRPRGKADWLMIQTATMSTDQWLTMLKLNAERIHIVKGRQRVYQFTKSLCEEYGFACPEFSTRRQTTDETEMGGSGKK
jgi:hypothetical protein